MNEPLPPRAVRTADEIVPPPSEQTPPGGAPEVSFDDVIAKANAEATAPGTSVERRRSLERAVSMLYAGESVDTIVKSFQIK